MDNQFNPSEAEENFITTTKHGHLRTRKHWLFSVENTGYVSEDSLYR